MKKGVFLIMLVLTAVLGITSISYAAELTWDTVPGHHNQSILLGPDEKFSKDVIWYPSRGEFAILFSWINGMREDRIGFKLITGSLNVLKRKRAENSQ